MRRPWWLTKNIQKNFTFLLDSFPVARFIKASIIGLFVFGIVFMLSIATTSFRQLFGIPEFDFGFNSSVPTLILNYGGMILYLNYFVPKFKVETAV